MTRSSASFTIGIITALHHEYAAMKALLYKPEPYTAPGRGAGREYLKGQIPSVRGGHHRVILHLGALGNNMASVRVSRLMEHFPTIDSIIMTGIAGGVPHPENIEHHVRLGDIVVSDHRGVIQYDMVKDTGAFTEIRSAPRPPAARWLEAVRLMQAAELEEHRPWDAPLNRARKQLGWKKPAQKTDRLAASDDPNRILRHPRDPRRKGVRPRVFAGPIAAANVLLKNASRRDALRDMFQVKAVEMEGSGIADATWEHECGYLVVRGICDYCDAHKGDDWQKYAALAAAAYTYALIASRPVEEISQASGHRVPRHRVSAPPAATGANPFSSIMGIREPSRFIGRTKACARVMRMLRGGSVAIIGEPKIGKSSLLYAIKRTWTGPSLGPFDLQGIEDTAHFFQELARALGQQSSRWPTLYDVLRKQPLLLLLDEFGSCQRS